MDKRIVITGANGMLGSLCVEHFSAQKGCEVVPLTRKEMNLEKDSAIRRTLDDIELFDTVIHTAAMTDVDGCEDNTKLADQINGYATGMVGHVSADVGAQTIYISTDYVFDGEKEEPYTEEDEVNPISAYGESKQVGEEELFSSFPDHLAVRISWVFGPGKQGFPEWIIRQAMAKDEVKAVSDKFGSPSYAVDVAKHLESFVFSEEPYGGILHLCNTGSCSWQEWGQFCVDCADKAGIPLKSKEVGGMPMEEVAKLAGWKAKRPQYSTLSTDKFEATTGNTPRSWQDAVEEYVETHLAPKLKAE